jgi:septum site-determining protein MinC
LSTNLELRLNPQNHAPPAPLVSIRYGQVGLVQVRIHSTDPGVILDELTGRVAGAPHFFRRTAACLDLSALPHTPAIAEARAAIDAIRRAGMLIVGLSGAAAELESLASGLSLPVIATFRAATVAPAPSTPAESTDATSASPALIHAQPVRSGQRVVARDRDLVLLCSVGAGAEVMADGCLHVYGALRGRALAGAHGQSAARLFCQEFYAELVSIAGVFRVFETLPAELAGKPVQAWLEGDHLHFARIGG